MNLYKAEFESQEEHDPVYLVAEDFNKAFKRVKIYVALNNKGEWASIELKNLQLIDEGVRYLS